ncbi:hypothetical protein Bca52824_018785 [Brassica carinata]|uniref:Uncharacterized protein n=1 Tax=Brassica carinata TaxID=52824 RepID=A0A8X7VPH9_BRACI|nr:hypothetical protein Bca52824_018785 [Brassica carinata]
MPEPRRGVRRGRVTDAAALNQQQPTTDKKQSKRVAEGVTERQRPKTRLAAAMKLKEEDKVNLQVGEEEEEEKEVVMAIGNDSGGSNKAAAQEEEGNTAPFPERVQVGGSPIYKFERK